MSICVSDHPGGEKADISSVYEITYKAKEEKDAMLAEDNVVVRGKGFRVGDAIKGFCKHGDTVFLVIQAPLYLSTKVKTSIPRKL